MPQKKLYNHKKIYSDYAKRDYLFDAEKQLLKDLSGFLKNARMLDMGVGGGRTTKYFAPYVKTYTGADYSPGMISECKKKYGSNHDFIECDARRMRCFDTGSFDFVLFSYNGIDSFGCNDRLATLQEIRRVLSRGGYFCFSSHNLEWSGLEVIFGINYVFRKMFNGNKGRRPGSIIIAALKGTLIKARLHFLNKTFSVKRMLSKIRSSGYGMIYDNSLGGKAKIFYTSFSFQKTQLEKSGFSFISAYAKSGAIAATEEDLFESPWVYYLCKTEK